MEFYQGWNVNFIDFWLQNVAFKGSFMNDVDRIFTPPPLLTSLLHKLKNVVSLTFGLG